MQKDFMEHLCFFDDSTDAGMESSATLSIKEEDVFPIDSDIDDVHGELACRIWKSMDKYMYGVETTTMIVDGDMIECECCRVRFDKNIDYSINPMSRERFSMRFCPMCGCKII